MPADDYSQDASREKELQRPNSSEALSWLQRPGETWSSLSGGDGSASALFDDEAIKFVQHLYDLGARRVTAIDIEGYEEECDGLQDTDRLVIELPEELALRKQLFDWMTSFNQPRGWATERDAGQKYLLVWWP